MKKLYYVADYKIHPGSPIINGRQTREMILEEFKDFSPQEVQRIETAVKRLQGIVRNAYRINAIIESSKEYNDTLRALNSDRVSELLRLDRKFRAYALEFDMFLDYWETFIAHYKCIDGGSDKAHIDSYKQLFRNLTHNVYDNHLEYQLLDMIRNVTAHVQSPVSRIHVGLKGNEAYADRDVLLTKCKSGQNKMRILKAQPKEIELTPIVNVTAKCLEEIHDGLIDYELDDLVVEECRVLASFIQNADSKEILENVWIIMDKEAPENGISHIKDIPIYQYLLNRVQKLGAM